MALEQAFVKVKEESNEQQPARQYMYLQKESLVCHHLLLNAAHVLLHHGGSGTTAAALVAGVPQLVMPLQFDQFYWVRLCFEVVVLVFRCVCG